MGESGGRGKAMHHHRAGAGAGEGGVSRDVQALSFGHVHFEKSEI